MQYKTSAVMIPVSTRLKTHKKLNLPKSALQSKKKKKRKKNLGLDQISTYKLVFLCDYRQVILISCICKFI